MRHLLLSLAALALVACGSAEETSPEPVAPAEAEPEAEPEPEPEPEPVADCPEDGFAMNIGADNVAVADGVAASGVARAGSRDFTRIRVCKTVDGAEVRMECTPLDSGAECILHNGDETCRATLPRPLIPAVFGMLVDTGETPTEGEWSCR